VKNNFFKNHGSQIETLGKIVHTHITALFKGAQLTKYAVWVLILLCCAATKCPVRQCFYALFTLCCKIETSLDVFLQLFFTQMKEKKKVLRVLASSLTSLTSLFILSTYTMWHENKYNKLFLWWPGCELY